MGLFDKLFNSKKEIPLEDMTSRLEEPDGWNDVFLKITETDYNNTYKIYTCKGLYKNKLVGLKIEVRTDIKAGITADGNIDPDNGFAHEAVRLLSIGEESNEFIRSLSSLYGFPTNNSFIAASPWLTVFSLNQKPVALNLKDIYKLKLFLQTEDDYAELFLNINTMDNEIELHEKDEDYRGSVINCLTI